MTKESKDIIIPFNIKIEDKYLMSNNLVYIGVISSAYHLKGLVKITSHTANPMDIFTLPCFDNKGINYKLKLIKQDKKKLVARIEGIDDRTKAEKILGTKLYTNRSSLPALEEMEHYIHDLVGVDVKDMTDNIVGKVKAFYNFGAGDIIEVTFLDKKSELFPFTKELFPEIGKNFIRFET